MHKFIDYISDLLFLHDCVIIPDFGGFICNYKSAYIDADSGMICPPGKDILFNRNLTHNDGLLVNWIADKENISYDKAAKQLTLFCEDLKIRLNQKQRVVFGDIGVFFTDRRFNIIFEPGKNNFFSEAFGMEAIVMESVITHDNGKLKPKQINIPSVTTGIPDMPAAVYMNNSGNFLHRLLKYGLAAAGIAGIAVILQMDIFNFDNEDTSGIITNTSTVQPTLPVKPASKAESNYNSVISPQHDYVDYDPLSDLTW